ncbi:hypothetical protein GCM10029992_04830 [Glycomyces albus]
MTVTGIRGSGKTTLIGSWARLRVPAQPDGVWYCVPGDDLGSALLSSLGRQPDPFRHPVEAAVDHLRPKEALLVLDEVDRDHAWAVEKLLRECPRLTVLAAGARPLELPGEAKRALPRPRPRSRRRSWPGSARTAARPGAGPTAGPRPRPSSASYPRSAPWPT